MNLAALSLGALGVLAQVVLFREALVRAGGDGLALGPLLASWLAAGALGALLARIPGRHSTIATRLGLLLFAAALLGGTLAWRGAPGLAGTLPGERQGALLFALQALLWNGPTAVTLGWLFARLSGGETSDGAPRLVSLEALGAALAGVLLALPPVLAWIPSGAALESRQGRFEVVERGGERWLRHDGRDRWALDAVLERDGQRALDGLLLNAPPAARVLLAADPDFLPAVLAHGPAEVELLLADPALEQLLRREAGSELARGLRDGRVCILHGGLRHQLPGEPRYDAIWLGNADPDRAGSAQLVTVGGLERIAAALSPAGLVGLRLGAIEGVRDSLGMQRACLIAAGLADAGLEPLLLGDGTLLGTKSSAVWCLDPLELATRAAERGVGDPLQGGAAWRGLFDPVRLEAWNRLLRRDEELVDPLEVLVSRDSLQPSEWPPFEPGARHTDRRPLARGLSARIVELHARGGRPELLAAVAGVGALGQGLAALLLLGALSFAAGWRRPRGTRGEALGLTTTSFVTTVGFLLVLEHYQARTGALYADLGWLAGGFLLGFSGGSRLLSKLHAKHVELGAIAILCGIGLWILAPSGGGAGTAVAGVAASALLLGGAAGAVVGGGARARGLRWAWGLDLAAAVPGALLASLVLLPSAGWVGCLAILLALETIALLVGIAQSRASRGTPSGEGVIGSIDPQDP